MKRFYIMSIVQNKLLIILLTSIFMLLVTKISVAESPPLTHGLTSLKKTFAAPELRLKNMDEEIIDIKDMKGQVIVINFWATWCPPCRREMSSLERLHQKTINRNVTVLAVNVGEDIDTVFSFFGTVDPAPTFPIVFDHDSDAATKWKIKGLPTTYIVDADGVVIYRAIGGREFDHPELMRKVVTLHMKH